MDDIEYEDLTMDDAGYWHFKDEQSFEEAPQWKRFTVGLINKMVDEGFIG